ncbi:hypothetical protein JTS93_15765 [Clostridium botulinum]|nr:hypothetical protein [Clostridium botulinum]
MLQDDDRTVILTLADEQEQHDEVTVKVKKVFYQKIKLKILKNMKKM